MRFLQEGGNLDLLVNNAYGGLSALVAGLESPFWEVTQKIVVCATLCHLPSPVQFFQLGPGKWDAETRVGLRSAYICTALATKIMVNSSKPGLIVNVASSGGMR